MESSPAGGTDLSLTGGSLTTIQSETIASADSPEGPVGGEQSAAFARLRVVQEGGVMTVTTSDSPEATAGRDESDALARLLTMQAGGAMCTVYVCGGCGSERHRTGDASCPMVRSPVSPERCTLTSPVSSAWSPPEVNNGDTSENIYKKEILQGSLLPIG